jgi:probable F420-dependent oxidoreductase
MRFGLALPHYDFSLPDGELISYGRAAEVARTAERLGFSSLWISDHFFLSLARYGGSPKLAGSLEALTTISALAAQTEQVRLGTLVLCAPFRHPAIVAKMATAADLVAGGRLDLGVGAGWYEDEFTAFGYPYGSVGERFAILEESLLVLGALFDEGPADYQGSRFHLEGAYNRPPPAQTPRPRVWIGSKGGPRSLRLAALHADGWNTVWRWAPQDYAQRVDAAKRICQEEGRDPATLRLSVGLYTLVGEDERDLRARFRALQRWAPKGSLDGTTLEDYSVDTLTGTPDRVRDRVEEFAALGVEEMIISPASLPFALFDQTMLDVLAEVFLGGGTSEAS